MLRASDNISCGWRLEAPGSRGLTVLEVILALVLLATGMVSLVELLQRAQAASADAENVMVASQLAQRRLEQLRNVAYDTLASESNATITSPAGYERFSRQVTITTASTNLKQVIVTVSWTAPGGVANVQLETYRSKV